MKIFNYTIFAITGIITVFTFLSCNIDPWKTQDSPTDKVIITKTTKYETATDGITLLKSHVGGVEFSHRVHEQEVGLACVDCHHKENNAARIKTCAAEGCHTGEAGYHTMHALCLDCHMANNGPQMCKDCH